MNGFETQINCNRCQYTFENCWFYRVLYCILHQSSVCITYSGQIFRFRQWDTPVLLFLVTHERRGGCWWNKLESVKYFIAHCILYLWQRMFFSPADKNSFHSFAVRFTEYLLQIIWHPVLVVRRKSDMTHTRGETRGLKYLRMQFLKGCSFFSTRC